jgi:non-ribosomal peptide synthetase component F
MPELTSVRERCLHELFEVWVGRTPDAPAVRCAGRSMSYSELDRRSNQLARRLRQVGVGPGGFVALFFDRSELPIIALLACHKSGAAYVPVDTTHPPDRIQYIARESNLALCLTERALAARAA